MLHARQVPPTGGDTMFANMVQAYESLSDGEKKSLEGLRCTHSWEASRRNTGNKPATEEQKRERPPVSHPLVRTHPDGRNPYTSACISIASKAWITTRAAPC